MEVVVLQCESLNCKIRVSGSKGDTHTTKRGCSARTPPLAATDATCARCGGVRGDLVVTWGRSRVPVRSGLTHALGGAGREAGLQVSRPPRFTRAKCDTTMRLS